jgi:hypothetical protein
LSVKLVVVVEISLMQGNSRVKNPKTQKNAPPTESEKTEDRV